jgi:hypothetical protein
MDEHRPDESRAAFGEPPAAGFRRFEKVLVAGNSGRWYPGTILWCDLVQYSQYAPFGSREPPQRWSEWEYAVDVPDLDRCATLKEDRLRAIGEFDPEEAHLGRRFEISFDTGLGDDMDLVEGSYRIPGRFWQVFTFTKGRSGPGSSVPELRHHFHLWESGITGIVFDVPLKAVLDREYMLRAFAGVFGTEDWVEVRGPDSGLMK